MSDIIRFPQPATSSSLTAFGLTKADDACSSLDMAELYDRIHEENTVDLGQDAPEANVSFSRSARTPALLHRAGPTKNWQIFTVLKEYSPLRVSRPKSIMASLMKGTLGLFLWTAKMRS